MSNFEKDKYNLKASSVEELLVKIIYGDMFDLPIRFLDARLKVYWYEEEKLENLFKIIEKIYYNDFDGERVIEFFRRIKDKIFYFEFGRENSPVIYFQVKKEYKEELDREIDWLKTFFFDLKASEVSCVDDDCLVQRVWWD